MKCRAAMGCSLAIVLAGAGGPAAFAFTLSGRAAALIASLPSGAVIAVANAVSFSVEDIEAEAGAEAQVAIVLPSPAELPKAGAEEGAFILIRNIPQGVSMSAGMATGRICVVPLGEARRLRLTSKPEMAGSYQLDFHLIGPNNGILAEKTVTLKLRGRESLPASSAPPAGAPAPPQAVVPVVSTAKPDPAKKPARFAEQAAPLPPEEEEILLARGKDVLRQGGIAAARLIFEELARHGSAAGALALARSYDAAYVAGSPASAPSPSLTEALKWYERAAELGNPDAKRRLAEIVPGGR